MISLFRKIRIDALFKDKLSRYLLYAAGEILLVVLGILIALYINNQNEYQPARTQSEQFLKEMIKDLSSDTLYLSVTMDKLQNQLDVEDWLIRKEEFSEENLDSIKMYFKKGSWSFYINDRTFQKIQYSANSQLTGLTQDSLDQLEMRNLINSQHRISFTIVRIVRIC